MPDDLDPCDVIDFTDPDHVTEDGDQQVAITLFADIDWTDPAAVEARRAEWEALTDA